jgi:hypothetical protein
MAAPTRKILFPKFKPTIPIERIREAVRKVSEEARLKEAEGKHAPSSKSRRIEERPA